jgi:CheY-like chemotaxis protein
VVCREANTSINCETLDDGNKAIAYLEGSGPYADREKFPLPGVILLDLKMPIKTGFEVLAWMRAQPGLKYLPVIVFTASKQEADMTRAYDLGANAFVVKPNTMAGLETLVNTIKGFWLTWNEEPVDLVATRVISTAG